MFMLMSGFSVYPSLTSFMISSIHLRSAAVRATIRSTLGLRNSIAPVSIYPSNAVRTWFYFDKLDEEHLRSRADQSLSVA